MRHMRIAMVLPLFPLVALFLASAGCGGDTKKVEVRSNPGNDGGGKAGEVKGTDQPVAKAGEKEELVAKEWGTLKGKVTFDGDPPAVTNISIPDSVKEKDICLQGDTRVQTWKVGPDKGVANVIVWLRAPRGKYFGVPEDQQKAENAAVKLDQSHCAFEPHVMVLYPSFYDPKTMKQKATGQVLEILNSAPFNHNTNWSTSDTLLNSGRNIIIQAHTASDKAEKIPVKASKPKDSGGEQQFTFTCNIHNWMKGFARVFDHPYAAVSTGDAKDAKEFGTYEIKKVPAGEEVELVYWHESMSAPKVLKKIAFKAGDNVEDFKVK